VYSQKPRNQEVILKKKKKEGRKEGRGEGKGAKLGMFY
jgi:hypothetical protein